MPDPVKPRSLGSVAYTVAGSFLGAAAGGGWLGLVLLSLAGLYGSAALWQDLLAIVVAGGAVAGLAYLCGHAAEPHGRPAGLRVVLVAAVAALNVVAVLYLFGEWVCRISPQGAAFTDCRISALASPGGLSPIAAVLVVSPAALAAATGALVTIRGLQIR